MTTIRTFCFYLSWLYPLLTCSTGQAQEATPEFTDHPYFHFGSAQDLTADIALVDIDKDGDLDALAANGRHWAQQDYAYFNAGQGRMLEAAPIGNRHASSYILAPGDFDGDGDIDLAVVRDKLAAQVFSNDGNGNFRLRSVIDGSAANGRSAAVLDANNDGFLDVVVVTRRGADTVYLGDGKGRFPSHRNLPGDGSGSTGVAAADLDGDGDIDLVVARRDGNKSVVMTNLSDGRYRADALAGSSGDHRKALIADLNQDTRQEIVLLGTAGVHKIYKQSAAGDFLLASKFGAQGRVTQAFAAGDLDGDGDVDIVEGSKAENVFYLNAGDGTFSAHVLPGENTNTYGVGVADMNGDGRLDIVFANSGSQNQVLIQE